MARLQADEDFKASVVLALRTLGHDVRTAHEAGFANRKFSDEEVLARSTATGRVLLTHNRSDFIRLHRAATAHAGIVVCRQATEPETLARQIDAALAALRELNGVLVRVYLQGPPQLEADPGESAP